MKAKLTGQDITIFPRGYCFQDVPVPVSQTQDEAMIRSNQMLPLHYKCSILRTLRTYFLSYYVCERSCETFMTYTCVFGGPSLSLRSQDGDR